MVVTYKKAFPQVYIFQGQKSRNFIFVATASSKMKNRARCDRPMPENITEIPEIGY